MKKFRLGLFVGLFLSGSLLSSISFATARLDGKSIILPYVSVGDKSYSVVLALIENSVTIDFAVVSADRLTVSGVRIGTSDFSDNTLVISVLRSGHVSYQVQLNYIAEEAVFRLIEPVVTLTDTVT